MSGTLENRGKLFYSCPQCHDFNGWFCPKRSDLVDTTAESAAVPEPLAVVVGGAGEMEVYHFQINVSRSIRVGIQMLLFVNVVMITIVVIFWAMKIVFG